MDVQATSTRLQLVASIAYSLLVGAVTATIQVTLMGNSLQGELAIGAGFFTALAVAIVVLPVAWLTLAWSKRFLPKRALLVTILGLTAAAIVGLAVSQIAIDVLVVAQTV